MTTEEEIAFLKGRVDALSQLCSFLVATHNEGANLAKMYRMRAEKDLSQPDLSEIDQAYASGYASVTPNIEAASRAFGNKKRAEP